MMFYWFYPMNGLYAYQMGTAYGQLLMDMRAQVPGQPNGNIYYVADSGKSEGPYSFDELRVLIREGKVTRDTYLWKPGMTDWQYAVSINEVTPLVSQLPPPLPGQE